MDSPGTQSFFRKKPMATSLAQIFDRRWITIPMSADTHERAVRELVHPLQAHPHVQDSDALFEEIWKREQQESTCVGNGIAFPHARCDSVDQLVLAAGVSPEGISFAGIHGKIHLVFCIGTPKRMGTEYLATVGALARLLKEETLRSKLLHAKNADQFLLGIQNAEKAS